MNPLSELRRALITRLGEISPANGYLTSAGSRVESGWFSEVIKSSKSAYPMIVVQKGRDGPPEHGPTQLKLSRAFFVFGSVDAGIDGYEDALDDIEHDILMTLMPNVGRSIAWAPRGSTKINIGTPEQVPPGNGEKAATVLIPVELSLIIGP